jgi:hypothetical protein
MSDLAKLAAGRDQVNVEYVIAVGEVHILPSAMLLYEKTRSCLVYLCQTAASHDKLTDMYR